MGFKDIQAMINERDAQQSTLPTGGFAGVAAMVAARTPEYAAPKIDRKAVFAKLDLAASTLTNDAIHGPNVVVPPPVRMISLAGGTPRPATPEEIANGMGHDVAPKASPQDRFKKSVQEIMASEDDPANKEKKIKSIQSAYKQREYEVELLPVQTYWDNKLIEEHDAEKHAQRVTGWIEAWQRSGWWGYTPMAPLTTMWNKYRDDPEYGHRFREMEDNWTKGMADVAGGVAGVFGAKDYARAAYLATKAPELADSIEADWVDKALGMSTRAAPYMVATVAASALTGGAAGMAGLSAAGWGAMGGGIVSFGVEGNSAYQNAIDSGVDDVTARQIGMQTGLINAAIEALPFGSGMKYLRPMKQKVQQIATTKLKAAGKWAIEKVKVAVEEALEEAGQEMGTMYGESSYRDIKGKEIVDRVMQAGAGGFFLGGTMGMAMSAVTAEGAAKAEADVAVRENVPPAAEQMGPARPPRFSTEDAVKARNDGVEATALYLRKAGVVDEGQIKMELDTIRTLADDVKDDIVTPAYAKKQLKAWGFGDNATPDQARVTARYMTDGSIKLFNGADSASVLHELGHNHFDTLDKATQKEIEKEIVQYETDNPDTTSASREPGVPLRHIKERYSDLVADYAVSTRIHKKVGVNLHKFLGAARDMWYHVLARVLNMRTNIAAGRMSNRLKEMLAAPIMAPEVAPIEAAGRFVPAAPQQGPPVELPRSTESAAPAAKPKAAPTGERAGQFTTYVPQGPEATPLPAISPWGSEVRKPRQGPSYQMVAPPQGGAVTAPRARYVDDIATDSKNVWVRPITGNYSIDNSKRTLLMQFASPLLTKNEDPTSKAYSDKLYALKPGYNRPADFWEIPQWIAEVANNIPSADVYVVRDMAEAKQFLKESGYKNVAFSALDVNQHLIKDLASGFDGEVSVGGYVGADVFRGPQAKTDEEIVAKYRSQLSETLPSGRKRKFSLVGRETMAGLEGRTNIRTGDIEVARRGHRVLFERAVAHETSHELHQRLSNKIGSVVRVEHFGKDGEKLVIDESGDPDLVLAAKMSKSAWDRPISKYVRQVKKGADSTYQWSDAGFVSEVIAEAWAIKQVGGRVEKAARAANPEAMRMADSLLPDSLSPEGISNIKWYDSVSSFTRSKGLTYRVGADYRHFQGTKTIARLCLSKGCLHKCKFCSVSKDLGKKGLEETSPEGIQSQIKAFKDLDTRLVYLNDKTFGQAKNSAEISRYGDQIAAQNPEFDGFVVQTTAHAVSKFSDDYLQNSHIRIVEIGVESYNNDILRSMKKPTNEKMIDAAAEKLRRNNMEMVPNVMVGLPGETKESYQRTLDFLEKNADIIPHVNIYNLALYEGTELADTLGAKTAADISENEIEKSWNKDPDLHKWFARKVYAFGMKQLDKSNALYELRPLEKKVAMKTTPVAMSSQTPIGILLTDGQVLPVGHKEIHADLAAAAGVGLDDLLKEGAVRYRASDQDVMVEAGTLMTSAQRDALISLLDDHMGLPVYFDYTSTMKGEGFASWMYVGEEDAAAILRDMDARLGKPVASYELRPVEAAWLEEGHNPIRMRKDLEAGFILSDGRVVAFDQQFTHGMVAGFGTDWKKNLYKEGVIRFRVGTGTWADVEVGEVVFEAHQPMTYDQREAVKFFLEENFGTINRVIVEAAPHARAGGVFSYSGEDNASDSVADMQARLDAAASQVATYQLQRADTAPVTVDQKIQMGIIPELLGYTEEQAAAHRTAMVGKADWSTMTFGEAKKVIADLLDSARAKGLRFNGAKTFGDWLAIGIQKHATSHTDPVNALRPGELASWWKRIKKGIRGWDVASTRIERLCMELGGYEKGSLYNAFFLKVREAADTGEVAAIARAQGFKSFLETSFDKPRLDALLSTKQEEVVPGKYLDPAEQMSFLMMAKNDHGLRRLVQGHGFSAAEVAQILRWITTQRPDVKATAEWMLAQYEEQFVRLDAAHFAATGDHLNKEDFYSPLYLRDVELEQQHDYLADLIGSVESQSNAPQISETIDRTMKAAQPVHMDAVENYLFNSRRVERYIALAPSVSRSAKILNNRNFKAALNGATSGYGNVILGDWLRDTARGYAAEGQGLIDKTMRLLRRKSMVYVLGAKFTASTRQVLSLFKSIAVDPKMIPAVAQTLMLNPIWSSSYRKMEADVFATSPMMKGRSFDRIEAQLKQSTSARMKLKGKTLWDEKLLWTLRTMDRHIAVISWKASFDVAKSQGMIDKDAIKWADEVVRTTQSMGEAVDLPAFFRGGTLAKLLTTFENDNNQNYNYWRHDVFGQFKTGKIGVGGVSYRILMSYVIPALLMGMIGRGGTPEDMKDVATDLASFPLASIVLFGRWSYAAFKGIAQGNTIADVPFGEAAKTIAAVKQGNAGKAAWQGLKTAAAFTGAVPQQAFTTTEGAAHLMTDEDNNARLRELLFTRSQLGLTKKSESGTGEKKGGRR